jgi:hypothetical protein
MSSLLSLEECQVDGIHNGAQVMEASTRLREGPELEPGKSRLAQMSDHCRRRLVSRYFQPVGVPGGMRVKG